MYRSVRNKHYKDSALLFPELFRKQVTFAHTNSFSTYVCTSHYMVLCICHLHNDVHSTCYTAVFTVMCVYYLLYGCVGYVGSTVLC